MPEKKQLQIRARTTIVLTGEVTSEQLRKVLAEYGSGWRVSKLSTETGGERFFIGLEYLETEINSCEQERDDSQLFAQGGLRTAPRPSSVFRDDDPEDLDEF